MEIEEAFTQNAIDQAGTNVTGEDEVRVRQMIRHVCEISDPPVVMQRDQENVAVLMFVGGRTYEQQFGNDGIDADLLITFIRFLQSMT